MSLALGILFGLCILAIAWFVISDIGEDMHYEEEREEYLERLRKEKEERKNVD